MVYSSYAAGAGKKWTYAYEFKNTSKSKTWIVGSSVPDRALGLSNKDDKITHLYKLKPGKSFMITVDSEYYPVECSGLITVYQKKKVAHLSDKVLTFVMSGAANGYVPKGVEKK